MKKEIEKNGIRKRWQMVSKQIKIIAESHPEAVPASPV